MSQTDTHTEAHADDAPHAVPLWLLSAVFGLLLVLTVVTVAAWMVDLGSLNIPIAIGIATVKASVVALYFMHLRWDNPFNGAVLVIAMVFVALFISFSLIDSGQYKAQIDAAGPPPSEVEGLQVISE